MLTAVGEQIAPYVDVSHDGELRAEPIALGMTHLHALRYLWLDAISCIAWAIIIPSIGYAFGAAAESMLGHLQGLAAAALAIVCLTLYLLGKRKLGPAQYE